MPLGILRSPEEGLNQCLLMRTEEQSGAFCLPLAAAQTPSKHPDALREAYVAG